MTVLAIVFSLLAGALHVGIWVAESFLWRRPPVWQAFALETQQQADDAVFFTFNQGFYNLFLAIGAVVGPICIATGSKTVGWTLLVYACASMLAAAGALRLGSDSRYTRAASMQALFPTLALVSAAVVGLA